MKYSNVFDIRFIAIAMGFPMLMGCNPDNHITLNGENAQVSTRAEDCDDCDDDCCCFIELDGDDAASVLFCGTTDGASACSQSSSCGSLNGGGQLIVLSVGTPRKLFCAETNGSFYIRNWSTSDEVDVIKSCQAEDGTPQTLMVHLSTWPNPGSEFYYSTNGDCEVDDNC